MTFEQWLQGRLVIHGARIAVDGDWGRTSIEALRLFQKSAGLPVSGLADVKTVAALRKNPPAAVVAGEPEVVPAVEPTMPPWMAEMHRRSGLHEVRDSAALIDWLKIGRFLGNPKSLPWCGDAVETCIAKTLPSEPLPSNPFFAQAWKGFGRDIGAPIVGSIGVIRWNATSGHVGFVAGVSGSQVHLLGGNQANAINVAAFPRAKFIAFRWPATYPVQHYPAMRGAAPAIGDLGSTR